MSPEILKKRKYDGKKADIFAAAVILFIMIYQHQPFRKASPNDRYYKKVVSGKHEEFWSLHEKKYKSQRDKSSEDFKDLFLKMIHFDPEKRITLEQVKQHKWFDNQIPSQEDIKSDMKLRAKI